MELQAAARLGPARLPDTRRHAPLLRDLGRIYLSTPALYRIDDGWEGFDWLNVDDAQRSSVAFMRMSRGSYVVCAVNFTPVKYDNFVFGLPNAGVLRELINSDDVKYGGSGALNAPELRAHKRPFLNHPYSVEITLPPMSCVYFRFSPSKPAEKRKRPAKPAAKRKTDPSQSARQAARAAPSERN